MIIKKLSTKIVNFMTSGAEVLVVGHDHARHMPVEI